MTLHTSRDFKLTSILKWLASLMPSSGTSNTTAALLAQAAGTSEDSPFLDVFVVEKFCSWRVNRHEGDLRGGELASILTESS